MPEGRCRTGTRPSYKLQLGAVSAHIGDDGSAARPDTRTVYAAGPRVDRRYLREIGRLDDPTVPVAETYRLARELAAAMDVPRPSYERVRIHLRSVRSTKARRAQARELALQLAYNTRAADAVVADLLALIE